MLEKVMKRLRRHNRVRARITGTAERPRLCVFRSNTRTYAQLIDDATGRTLCASCDMVAANKKKKATKTERATIVGQDIATQAIALGIKTCVFDRGGYLYHGRVKAIAEGAREAGLIF